MSESIWSEIKCNFYDEKEHVWVVDAWLTGDDNESGKFIAKIHESGKVTYFDEKAKTDMYAQEIIAEKRTISIPDVPSFLKGPCRYWIRLH